MEKMCGGMQLTRKQRFIGFGICFGVGCVISLLSTLLIWTGNLPGYAIMYTFGNLVALVGTGFLVGFLSQFKVNSGMRIHEPASNIHKSNEFIYFCLQFNIEFSACLMVFVLGLQSFIWQAWSEPSLLPLRLRLAFCVSFSLLCSF